MKISARGGMRNWNLQLHGFFATLYPSTSLGRSVGARNLPVESWQMPGWGYLLGEEPASGAIEGGRGQPPRTGKG